MSKKAIVDIYFTYGKGDGDELGERFVINNTVEEREGIFEHFDYDEAVDNKEDFVHGKRDVFVFYNYGGDWDEPTGGYIVIKTKDELINDIRENAQKEIAKVEKLFAEEVK